MTKFNQSLFNWTFSLLGMLSIYLAQNTQIVDFKIGSILVMASAIVSYCVSTPRRKKAPATCDQTLTTIGVGALAALVLLSYCLFGGMVALGFAGTCVGLFAVMTALDVKLNWALLSTYAIALPALFGSQVAFAAQVTFGY